MNYKISNLYKFRAKLLFGFIKNLLGFEILHIIMLLNNIVYFNSSSCIATFI